MFFEEKILRQVIDNVPIPIFIKDSNRRYIECNDAFASFVRLKKEDIIGNACVEFINYNDEPKLYDDIIFKVIKKQEKVRIERTIELHDGRQMFVEIIYMPLIIDNKAEGFYGIIKDVTEIKSFQEEMANEYLAAYDDFGISVYLADLKTKEIIHCNEMAYKTFGDCLGMKCYEAVCCKNEICDDCVSSKHLPKKGSFVKKKHRYNSKIDKYFNVNECIIKWKGEEVRMGLLFDSTSEYRLEQKDRESYELIKLTLNTAPLGCVILDENYNTIQCNEYMIKMFEAKSEDEVLSNYFRFSPEYQPDGKKSLEKHLENMEFVKQELHYSLHWVHQTASKSPIPCQVNLSIIDFYDKKLILGYITDLREYEKTMRYAENLKMISITDALTNAFNRRYFDDLLKQSISESRSNNKNLCLLMFDIDRFKTFNDLYGHQVGDMVLKSIAELSMSILPKDYFARYGGEEFIAILKDCSIYEASDIAEKLRMKIQGLKMYADSEEMNVTVSIGVTMMNDNDDSSSLLGKVDKTLYIAKRNGRNRVEISTEHFN